MLDDDNALFRRAQRWSLLSLLAFVGGGLGILFGVEVDGRWSVFELASLIGFIGGPIGMAWGFVLHRRSGAALSLQHNPVHPDGTPVPRHIQWQSYTYVLASVLFLALGWSVLNGEAAVNPALMLLGAFMLAFSVWQGWFRPSFR